MINNMQISDTRCTWSPWNNPQKPRKETPGTGGQRKN